MTITKDNVFDHVTKTEELPNRWRFTSNDGRLIIVASKCTRCECPNSLMSLWKKHGYIKEELDTYVSIETYYYDEDNNCTRRYNVTEKRDMSKHISKINFDYLKEWTEENVLDLVIECLNMRENGIEAIYV